MAKYITFNNMNETQQAEYDAMDFDAQIEYDAKLLDQEVKAYVKEYNRLLKKHDYSDRITTETVTGKAYFEDDIDSLTYTGGKHMAQYDGYNGGLWGEDEVKMWQE